MNKKIIYISVLIAVIFISAFTGIIVYYNGVINNKDSQIALLNTQNTNLNNQIANLNSQISSLTTFQQVRLSGYVSEYNATSISFSSTSTSIVTSSLIYGNQYNVVLLGNQAYSVTVNYIAYSNGIFGLGAGYTSTSNSYTIYIPSGVTTFTANF